MTSRLAEMQARFQQRQMQEKEEKLLKLYETQQQRAFDRVSRGSAGSNTSVGSTGGGKVRQMFDERRQKAGVDRSYPLEPLKSKTNSRGGSMDRKANVTTTSRTTVRSTVQKSVSSVRNGKPIVSKREALHSIYNNNDGDESYEEHRFEDMNNDLLNANTDRGIIAMMDSHNINDNLDDEVMPQIGFDEVDNVLLSPRQRDVVPKPVQNGVTKKIETRSSLKANGISPAKKESNPSPRKPVKASTPAKSLSVSPAPAPVKSPRNTTPTSPSKTPTSTMSAKQKTPNRAPTSSRPSAKQSAKTGVTRDDLMECNFCGRRFAADRLQKHEDICSKTGKKKRKVYDATKHRVGGTELESYVLRGQKGKSAVSAKHWKHGDSTARQEIISKSKQGSKKDWRKTHEEFIAAIRAAKQTQAHLAKGGKLSDLPPPPPSSNPDYVQCPHCGRRFNEAAAERHIPKCANFQFNKPKPRAAGKR